MTAESLAATAARLEALEKLHERDIASLCKLAEERDRRYSERFDAQQRETDLARGAMGIRLEGMNEIREQLSTQQDTFATRELVAAIDARVTDLERRANLSSGKEGGTVSARALLFSIIAAGGSLVGVIMLVIHLAGG